MTPTEENITKQELQKDEQSQVVAQPTEDVPVQVELGGGIPAGSSILQSVTDGDSSQQEAEEGAFTATNGTTIVLEEAKEDEAAMTDVDATYGSETGRTIEELVNEEADEAETQPVANFSITRTLGGVIIARAIQRQIGLVLLIFVFILIYITCGFFCQKQMGRIEELEKELVKTRYKTIVCTSRLTEMSRESNIIKMLKERGDSTLHIQADAPFRIKVEE